MTRKDMYAKYSDTLMAMYKETGDDNSVCLDKLIYTYKNRGVDGADVYPGIPQDFDWGEFGKDYAELIA